MAMRLGLIFAITLAGATTAAAMQSTGKMPDAAKQYHKRSNCHNAYDLLIEDANAGRAVSAEDRAFGKAYEDNAANGTKCPQPSDALMARAADHFVVTQDGLAKLAAYHKQKDAAAYFEAAYSVLSEKTKIVTPQVGFELLNQANILGSPEANYFSGALYVAGVIGGKVNYEAGFPHLLKAAEAGHLDAIFTVGSMYVAGLGTKKDTKLGFEYLTKAAERGHVFAAYLMAQMATSGDGIKKDQALAYRLGRNLADQGEVSGAIIAAGALLQMKDAKEHEDEVLYWMDLAARDGDAEIRKHVNTLRPQVVAAFKRAKAPPEYHPRAWKACPMKTVCYVDRSTGARQSCTTNKDYWNDCDG
jgi:TPR repeat protein